MVHFPGSKRDHADSQYLCYGPLDVHAFLGWFDINFSCCHKPVKFSTGPHAKVSELSK